MNGCIVYYSYNGNNRLLAEELQRHLGCAIYEVKEVKKRGYFTAHFEFLLKWKKSQIEECPINLSEYSYIVAVAPVWFQQVAMPMQAFLYKHKEEINALYFISLCNGVLGQKRLLDSSLSRMMGHTYLKSKQIWVNELLPENIKNVKQTFKYKVTASDMELFRHDIKDFISSIRELKK